MKKIPLTNEIASSYLSDSILESDYETLLNNPRDYVKSQFNIDLDSEIAIVKNQSDLINIALPYYSGLDDMHSFVINDDDLESISGGEIVGIIAALVVIGTVSTGIVASGIAIGVEAHLQAEKGNNLDGTPK